MQKEPAITVGVISALVSALLLAAAAFGLDVSEEQKSAMLNLIAPAFVFITAVAAIIRQFVWAPDTVKEEVAQAKVETIESLSTPTVLYHGGN